MNTSGWLQLGLYVVVLLLLAKPLGAYMAAVYEGRAGWAQRIGGPLERLIYRGAGVDPTREMGWIEYALAMLWFNLLGALVVYGLQRLQQWLPLNPQDMAAVSPDSAFNTATSFATNTNWQGYGGESTMSYLTQMLGLAVQNFVSAATGMAVLVALIRGFARKEATGIGNFWTDLVRTTVYILLPLSIVLSLALVSQGVPQTFDKYATVTLLQPVTYDSPKNGPDGAPLKDEKGNPVTEKATATEQTIPLGPAASQIAIKQLGTNGGGFYNVNSAHPFENPTPLANFLEVLSILLIGAALCYMFGKMIGDTRQGWALLAAMTLIFVPLLVAVYVGEGAGNPVLTGLGADQVATATNPGGNMEGKEVRFGVPNSALWAVATTSASNGSVNSMHDSFMPLVRNGADVADAARRSGLRRRRLGALRDDHVRDRRRVHRRADDRPHARVSRQEARRLRDQDGVDRDPAPAAAWCSAERRSPSWSMPARPGSPIPAEHGFSEILYAFSSASNNNGSAFAGLSANTPFYNTALGICMLFARYWLAIPVLALAGAFAAAKRVPPSSGTLPTHTPLFVFVLISTVITVGALTFVPALALGPVVEHLLLFAAK